MVVTELKSMNNIDKYNVDVLILPTKFSAMHDFVVDFQQLYLFNKFQIALKMDKIISENEILELEEYIKESISFPISYYIFTDMSVYYLLKKYNLDQKSVYFAKTINCSTLDILKYNNMNMKCLVSTELTVDDINKISNLKNNFIYTYGFFNMFYSKRKLLSLYKEYSKINYEPKNKKYYLIEETRKEYYPVFENNNGTFIFSSYAYLLFKEIELLNKNNYFYIDSTFISEDDLIAITNIYNEGFNKGFSDNLLGELKAINDNVGTSFLYITPEILKEEK